jgi:hypothetical protein
MGLYIVHHGPEKKFIAMRKQRSGNMYKPTGGNRLKKGWERSHKRKTVYIYMYISIKPNTITSNSTDYNSITLVS